MIQNRDTSETMIEAASNSAGLILDELQDHSIANSLPSSVPPPPNPSITTTDPLPLNQLPEFTITIRKQNKNNNRINLSIENPKDVPQEKELRTSRRFNKPLQLSPPVRQLNRQSSSIGSDFTTPRPRFTDIIVQEPQIKLPDAVQRLSTDRRSLLQRQVTNSTFTGVQYLNVETGEVISSNSPIRHWDYRKMDPYTGEIILPQEDIEHGVTIAANDIDQTSIKNLAKPCNDVEFAGRVWRRVLQSLLCSTRDEVNVLRITRALQFFIPFHTSYEAYLIGELIAAFRETNPKNFSDALSVIFQNRNVTRVLIRNMPRWDIFFHQDQQLKNAIFYDAFGVTIGLIGFPASENFVNTRNFTIASILRQLLGEGHFITRFLTGRQALITDNPDVIAQNLAAEGAGFESANRNQWGTYLGRLKTNQFRAEHRLPTDESIVRSFISLPLPTLVNNGVEHVLRQLTNHWRNMLYQPFGNFAHQRMEQLNPFEMLRFHFPVLLVVLSQLRGLCSWDAEVLGPFITKLQGLNGHCKSNMEVVDEIHDLITELKKDIMIPVCGGIASRIDLLKNFVNCIDKAIDAMAEEAKEIKKVLDEVQGGIRIARQVINSVDWRTPSNDILGTIIYSVLVGTTPPVMVGEVPPVMFDEVPPVKEVSLHAVRRALNLLAPKDKRTLVELYRQQFHSTHPATLLLERTRTLLKRELRRDALDKMILKLSKGQTVTEYSEHKLYWLKDRQMDNHGLYHEAIYAYIGYSKSRMIHIFRHFFSRSERYVTLDQVDVKEYIEIAEEITCAQKAFMTIELEYGKKFSYSGFMEFIEIRDSMLRLMSVSQLQCEALDDARMNILQAIQDRAGALLAVRYDDCVVGQTYFVYRNSQYEPFVLENKNDLEVLRRHPIVRVPPQSMLVIGSGPTGLLTTIHCLENVLLSGGTMRLYESRDAYLQGGATFERSQIVRLDARWIAMMRYHLGTIYEDVFVPCSGETDSHYGNSLPLQGFIEITIKDMENMMNIQVAKLLSRGLLKHDTNSGVQYDYQKNELVKSGKVLKIDDVILRKVDETGKSSDQYHRWKVIEMIPPKTIPETDLCSSIGEEYVIHVPEETTIANFIYIGLNIDTGEYFFRSKDPSSTGNLTVRSGQLPEIYKKGTNVLAGFEFLKVESCVKNSDPSHISQGPFIQEQLALNVIEKQQFLMDIENCHVVTATGKPHGSDHHFEFTTEEPYGVCCLSGLKVSMRMHNFGTRRWRRGIIDDIRSRTDQNTRVIGDFTKVVNSEKIAMKMVEVLQTDMDWRLHFEQLATDNGYGVELTPHIHGLLLQHVKRYHKLAPYKRHHLQTRFFETGDNFYLGMEFTREYDLWKKETIISILQPVTTVLAKTFGYSSTDKARDDKQMKDLKSLLNHHLDRLWYYSVLEVIKQGDVYNPGGKDKVPHLHLIDHHIPVPLSKLQVGETFISIDDPNNRYELLAKRNFGRTYIARNHEGFVKTFTSNAMVKLGGNLTRGPDGFHESKVALATFPVTHGINYRTMKLTNSIKGYTFAFLGDEQSSPHFMRYSGLTGAAINTMTFNNFIGQAIEGIPFCDRFFLYAAITDWSNGEVVQRGTSTNYGIDGFLRPGFPYVEGMKYLTAKVIEHIESQQDMNEILSRDWRSKFAAALIPRGMEYNEHFLTAMMIKVEDIIFDRFVASVETDTMIMKKLPNIKNLLQETHIHTLKIHQDIKTMDSKEEITQFEYWRRFIEELGKVHGIDNEILTSLNDKHCLVAGYLEQTMDQLITHAQGLRLANLRVSTVADTQPKSVDSIIDLFAPEAQAFASVLAQSSTFAALTLALRLVTTDASIVASAASAFYAMGTSTNGSRYKNRHEEWRVYFYDQRFDHILKQVYSCLSKENRLSILKENNPFYVLLEQKKKHFLKQVHYYGYSKPVEFLMDYDTFIKNYHDPSSIDAFLRLIARKYIADVYHVNSYLQENLVDIYLVLEEMLRVESLTDDQTISSDVAISMRCLFERLILFKPRLESSLQRGKVSAGAFRDSKVKHFHFAGILHYFVFIIWRHFFYSKTSIPKTVEETRKAAGGSMKPIFIETKEIIAQMKYVRAKLPDPATIVGKRYSIHRELVDMKSLYYATHESYVASCLVTSGIMNFFTGVVFFISNAALIHNAHLGWAERMNIVASFSFGIISPITAILAVYFYSKHFTKLMKCIFAVRKKFLRLQQNNQQNTTDEATRKSENLKSISYVGYITASGIALRVLASLLAAIALPWALAAAEGEPGYGMLPLYLAVCSAGLQVLTAFYLYIIEYTVLYKSTPEMGELCCNSFVDEIQQWKNAFTIPENTVQTIQVQERETWEYVARAFLHKYRFDTIYAANRFGAIMQYIHSGCVSSREVMESETTEITEPVSVRINTTIEPVKSHNTPLGSMTSMSSMNHTASMDSDSPNQILQMRDIYLGEEKEDPSYTNMMIRKELKEK